MRVLKQEFFKSFIRVSVGVILLFFILLNACLLFVGASTSQVSDRDASNAAFSYVLKLAPEQRSPYVDEHLATLMEEGSEGALQFANQFYEEFVILRNLQDQLKQIETYDAYLDSIQSKASGSDISIFQRTSDYTKTDQEATAEAFKRLEGQALVFLNSRSLIEATESSSVDVLAILFVLFFVISLVLYEKENGLFSLFSTMREGKASLIRAKILVVLSVATMSAILFWGSSFAISLARNKPFDLNAPVQSVMGYGSSALAITIAQYLALFLLAKMLVYGLLSMLALVIALKAKGTTMLYLSFVIVFFISLVARLAIPAGSALGLLHYINLIPYIQVTPILKFYFNLNLFGAPVPMTVVFWVSSCVILIALMAYVRFVFVRGRYASSFTRNQLGLRFAKKMKPRTSLFYHEAYKLLWMHKGLLVIGFLFVAQLYLANGVVRPDNNEIYYRNYLAQLEGDWSEEKEGLVAVEQKRFEDLNQLGAETLRKFQDKEISALERDATLKYVSEQMEPFIAFQRLLGRIEEMKSAPGEKRVLIYETGYHHVIGKGVKAYQDELMQAVLMILSLIILFSTSMSNEYETGMVHVIQTLKHGRLVTLRVKLILGLLVATVMFICSYLPSILAIHRIYPMKFFSSGLAALPGLRTVLSPSLPIWLYLILVYGLRLLMVYVSLFLVLAISGKVKQNNVALSLSAGLCVLPLVLRILRLDWVDYFSLNVFYSGTLLFDRVPGLYALILFVVPLVLLFVAWRVLRKQWGA